VTIEGWSCPIPLRDHETIVMGHGGGGKLSAELVEHLFVPAFDDPALAELADGAVVDLNDSRLAVSTDSFVIRPRFFPGGTIGDLAIHGTVNDVAMLGAQPALITVGFILEEGLPMAELGVIVESMAAAATRAGVRLVTGDTKVVDRGHGDGVYINTTGLGIVPDGIDLRPARAEPGDAVIVSGTIGDHGMAIMSVRDGLGFESEIVSDSAPLNGLVQTLFDAGVDVHVLRDPTRGGVAATLNEIAGSAGVGAVVEEQALPVRRAVASACEMLGMDPLHVANEGKLVAIVPGDQGEAAVAALQSHELGQDAVKIGEVVADHPGILVVRSAFGAGRVVDMQVGEQLPRIC
jgi:hydrogenase expression/formation protein HypE